MKRKYSQEEVEHHMTGRLYFNPDDLNIFVRRGPGLYAWTMNLGNKWSWVIMGAEVLVILLICVTVF